MPALKRINPHTRIKLVTPVLPLLLILISLLLTFVVARVVVYLIINNVLPSYLLAQVHGFRIHHFVYGNVIIAITSFLAIGLGIQKHKNLFAVCYGIGLGLVLDEFLLWVGDVNALTTVTPWIPHSTTVIAIVSIIIASIIMIDLYKIRLTELKGKHSKKKTR